MRLVKMRACKSGEPPAEEEITILTGRAGYACASRSLLGAITSSGDNSSDSNGRSGTVLAAVDALGVWGAKRPGRRMVVPVLGRVLISAADDICSRHAKIPDWQFGASKLLAGFL